LYSDITELNITDKYFPIPFYNSLMPNILQYEASAESADLHGHIIELSLDSKKRWKFHRIRTDRDIELKSGKYFGNNYKVAETTLSAILNPLTFADLVSSKGVIISRMYFKKQDDTYHHIKKFNNYVKRILISKHTSGNVIDLASGRGGDLAKYVGSNAKHILMLETDINAIDEVINRKYTIKTTIPFDLNIFQIDLTHEYKKNIKIIDAILPNKLVDTLVNRSSKNGGTLVNRSSKNGGTLVDRSSKNGGTLVDRSSKNGGTLFCHFAMHYFVETAKSATNIIRFIDHYLQKGELFIMTIFNGQRVFDL